MSELGPLRSTVHEQRRRNSRSSSTSARSLTSILTTADPGSHSETTSGRCERAGGPIFSDYTELLGLRWVVDELELLRRLDGQLLPGQLALVGRDHLGRPRLELGGALVERAD